METGDGWMCKSSIITGRRTPARLQPSKISQANMQQEKKTALYSAKGVNGLCCYFYFLTLHN